MHASEATIHQPVDLARQNPSGLARIHYLDNLRALAMLLGVFLHAGLAYADPANSIWLATDGQSSVLLDATIWFIHLSRMGLFFLLSGYFAKFLIEGKGLRYFLWNRCLRIAVPFLLFYPFLLAAMTLVIIFALAYVDQPLGLLKLIAEATQGGSGNGRQKPPGTMHLWFLYYLMLFTALAAIVTRLPKLKLPALCRRRWMLATAPLMLVPAVMAAGAPLPAPESFVPQWWALVFYGMFYAAGWQLLGREAALQGWQSFAWPLMLVCLALFVPYYWMLPVLDLNLLAMGTSQQAPGQRLAVACLTAYLAVLLTLVSLLFASRYLAEQSPWLRLVADASYWVYLVHLPIVLFLQTLLQPWLLPWWVKFTAVVVGTLIPCMATYLVFVRYTAIGWLLHGKRAFP